MSSVVITPLSSGDRNVTLHVYVKGDASGDLTDQVIADPADFGMTGENRFFTIRGIQSSLSGFFATLKFEYLVSDTLIWVLPEFESCPDFTDYGGLKDRSNPLDGSGKILLSTKGLADGDEGSFILRLKK
jgi:hypothetical protein